MSSFVVITDANAQGNRKHPDRLDKFKAIIGDCGSVYQVDEPDKIQALADNLVSKQKIDILGICGGDSTLHQTLTAFINAYDGQLPSTILLLRGGDMNLAADAMGFLLPAEQHLANFVDRFAKGASITTIRRSLLKVSSKDGNRYGFLFGTGLAASMPEKSESTSHQRARRGTWGTGKALSAFITQNKDYNHYFGKTELNVVIDGFNVPIQDFIGILAGTISKTGNGFEPLYRAEQEEGRFHILASGLSAGQIIGNLPRLYNGERLRGKDHFDFLASEVTIESEKPFRYMVDGQLGETEKVQLSIGLEPTFLVR